MNATKTNQECEQSRILEHVHVAGSILKDDDEANKGAMTNQDTDAAREDPLRVGRAPDLDLGGDVAPEEHLVAAAFGLGAAAGPAGEGQIEELRSPPSAISAASAPSAVLVTAKMFHVRLRDSWGNAVPFELFHVPFKSLGDDMRHLVGLREHGDYQDGRRGTEGSPAVCEAPGGAPAELHEAAPAIATLDEELSSVMEQQVLQATTSVRSSESADSLSSGVSASSVVCSQRLVWHVSTASAAVGAQAGRASSEGSSEGSSDEEGTEASSDLELRSPTPTGANGLQVSYSPQTNKISNPTAATQLWLGLPRRGDGTNLEDIVADSGHLLQLLRHHSREASSASAVLPYKVNVGLVKFKGRRKLRQPWADVTLYFPDYPEEDPNPEDMVEEFVIYIRMVRVSNPRSMGQGSGPAGLERGSLLLVPQVSGQIVMSQPLSLSL
mmetsp:Transcript_171650/g.550202  ORF Transcript_171650/g.550202 Transcript_171650/m.550202 type:complete len:440 (+) Transcript_171650:251-1570(+)